MNHPYASLLYLRVVEVANPYKKCVSDPSFRIPNLLPDNAQMLKQNLKSH